MIILKGNIYYFNLSGLLRILYSNKLTGILRLARESESISIHILHGKIVGVETNREDPIEDLIEPITWMSGEFNFRTSSERSIIRNITVPSDQLILLLERKEREFSDIKRLLPPLNSVLTIHSSYEDRRIQLLPYESNFLSKIDGVKTFEELINSINLDKLRIFTMVVNMIRKGVLKVAFHGNIRKSKGGKSNVHEVRRDFY